MGKRKKILGRNAFFDLRDMLVVQKRLTVGYKTGRLSQSRIWVEYLCSKCKAVHRVSFLYCFPSYFPSYDSPRTSRFLISYWTGTGVVKGRKRRLVSISLPKHVTLTELTDFLTDVFAENFEVQGYVKIYYPESLFNILRMNEEVLVS